MATHSDWAFLASHAARRGVCVWARDQFSVLLSLAFSYIWKDTGSIREIHQRMCVTPSYFPSTRSRFWYWFLISDILLVCSLFIPLACKYISETLLISFKIVFAENRKNAGFNIPPTPTHTHTLSATPGLWLLGNLQHSSVWCVCSLQMALILPRWQTLRRVAFSWEFWHLITPQSLKCIWSLPGELESLPC